MRPLPCRGNLNVFTVHSVRASSATTAMSSSRRHSPNDVLLVVVKPGLFAPKREYATTITSSAKSIRCRTEKSVSRSVEVGSSAWSTRQQLIYNTHAGPSMTIRRAASSKATGSMNEKQQLQTHTTLNSTGAIGHQHDHSHEHVNEQHHDNHEDGHSHSHGVFGFAGHDDHHEHSRADPEKFIETLKGGGDRGSRITLIGLFANVGLTAAKGAAGWFLHSASLLADAGHSMSDLLGDFVTLFCWRLSRRPKSLRYPYGYGKFETLGTVTVSLLLVGGALGIGFHSYNLLLEALYPTIQALPPGLAHDILQAIIHTTSNITSHAAHADDPGNVLDPNAAWFAAVSVVAKEWLYRITKKVADDENSGVLMANAIHHRSDAWSSLVALVAILGTWLVPGLPLDPLGGLIVSFVILGQGVGLLQGGFNQMMDRGVSEKTHMTIVRQLNPLFDPSIPSLRLKHLTAIRDVRAVRSGALMFVDLVAILPPQTTMAEAYVVQEQIRKRLLAFKKEISEVRVKMIPEPSPDSAEEGKP